MSVEHDLTPHIQTWNGFIRFLSFGAIGVIAIIVLMALFLL